VSTPHLQVIYDYVDPGSYLVRELLQAWVRSLERPPEVEWTPLELRVPGSEPLSLRDPAWAELHRFMAEEAEKAGIPFRIPGSTPWSRKAHELALLAREKGCFDPIQRAIFRAHFNEDRDIGRVDVLLELAADQGLDPGEVRTVLGVDRFHSAVEKSRRRLLDRGVRGVPTVEAWDGTLEGFTNVESFREFLQGLGEPPPDEMEHQTEGS
jgi:predicted DsbA family dithiol-disulfide isomerase